MVSDVNPVVLLQKEKVLGLVTVSAQEHHLRYGKRNVL